MANPRLQPEPSQTEDLGRLVIETSAARAELLGPDGHLRAINARARSELEAGGVAVACDRPWISLWHETSHHVVLEALARARSGEASHFTAKSAAGTTHRVELRALRGSAGQVEQLLAVCRAEHDGPEQASQQDAGAQWFKQLADAIPHLVWRLDTAGRLTYVNRRWREYYRRETLAASEWHTVIHPDDLARARAVWSTAPRGETSLEAVRLRRHDGAYVWFACGLVPVRDAAGRILEVLGTATEIEPLKQVEDALRESRKRLDTALRAAGMGTWVWQLQSDIVQADEVLCQLLGYSTADARQPAHAWLAAAHPEDRDMLQAAIARTREHGTELDVECRTRRADGEYVWMAIKGRVETGMAQSGPVMFGANVDVTHRKQLEEELRQAQKMEAIGQLAGGVAHDFNNLLMVIMGQASLLSAADSPELVEQAVREIDAAAERAASLTAQLLAFGRRQTMQRREIDLNEVVKNTGQMLHRLLGERVMLQLQPAYGALPLHADPNMLVQVLLNLALNARDAMPDGGQLTIRVSREQVQRPESETEHWACVSVEDTGEGIASDVMPRLFEPFFTTKPAGKGTGLGLSTVYGIVKQHHGFLTVDSTPGRGATFKFHLPLPARAELSAASLAPPQALQGHGELVLLVEDDAAVRAVTSIILQQHNYRLLVADDGLHALELFETRGSEIDLLLSDVVLPRGLSGVELAQRLRLRNPTLNVILCSGYSADKLEHGVDALPGMLFLQKPCRSELLLSSLRKLLDPGRGAPPA